MTGLRAGVLALCILMGLPAASLAQVGQSQSGIGLPQLGDGGDMAPAAERRLGDRIVRSLYRDPDYLDDPVIHDYVMEIWRPLLDAARLRGDLASELDETFAWQILLGKDRSVNAFALPGGYLGVHLGLVAVVSSRDELASVLAHELSHVSQRHIARSLTRQAGQAPWVMGALILGALAASKSPNAASAVVVGGQAAALQTQLNFSRDMEREADRVGFGILTQAGYAPQGFASMFEKLQQANRLNDSGAFPYLRSHPLTTERIADMQARVGSMVPASAPEAGKAAADGLEHAMVTARARLLSNAQVDALRRWGEEVQGPQWSTLSRTQQVHTLYGATLAALRMREFAAAQALLERLHSAVAGAPRESRQALETRDPLSLRARGLVYLLQAELALATNAPAQAQQALDAWRVNSERANIANSASDIKPANRAATTDARAFQMLQVQTYLGSARASDAAQILQTALIARPQDAQAWQWLAQANRQLGRAVAAVRCEAEASAAHLDYAAAVGKLKAAQDLVRTASTAGTSTDLIEASIVDTRLRQLEQLQREQMLER